MSEPVQEFEARYAERSRTTVEFLHEHGRYGKRCGCGEEGCEGFQMAYASDYGAEAPSWMWDRDGRHVTL